MSVINDIRNKIRTWWQDRGYEVKPGEPLVHPLFSGFNPSAGEALCKQLVEDPKMETRTCLHGVALRPQDRGGIWLPCIILLYLGDRRFGICADRDSELYKREQVLFGRPDKNDSIVICSPPSKWWHRQLEWVPTFNWVCWHVVRIWCPPWIIGQDQFCRYLKKNWPYCDVQIRRKQ